MIQLHQGNEYGARGVVVAREVRDATGGVGTQKPGPGSIPGARLPIAPQRLAAPEVVALTASREDLPTNAGDDFGLFQALPLAIAGGLALWGLIVWALI